MLSLLQVLFLINILNTTTTPTTTSIIISSTTSTTSTTIITIATTTTSSTIIIITSTSSTTIITIATATTTTTKLETTVVGNEQLPMVPAMAATKADTLEAAVEKRLAMLGEWFGRSAAHEILSRSIAILERYRSQDLQVPQEITIWCLISLAIAMSGLEDIDEKRKVLLQRCPLGVEAMRNQEWSLIMTLPFDQRSGL